MFTRSLSHETFWLVMWILRSELDLWMVLVTSLGTHCVLWRYNEWYPWGLQISLHIRSPGVNFGHLKSEVFRNGGVFRSKLWSSQIWSFSKWGGVFRSKLWSSQIWSFPKWGGGGGYFFLVWNSGKGLSGKFGQNFTVQPETCLCITDSLSHTTYVETKNVHAKV